MRAFKVEEGTYYYINVHSTMTRHLVYELAVVLFKDFPYDYDENFKKNIINFKNQKSYMFERA